MTLLSLDNNEMAILVAFKKSISMMANKGSESAVSLLSKIEDAQIMPDDTKVMTLSKVEHELLYVTLLDVWTEGANQGSFVYGLEEADTIHEFSRKEYAKDLDFDDMASKILIEMEEANPDLNNY